MKKLLAILGVSSIAVSSPLLVVSCAKKEAKLDFDHQKVVNEFIAEVTAIFQTAITEEFKQYEWVSEDEVLRPFDLTIRDFENQGDDLKDKNSELFRKVSTPIYEHIPNEKITSGLVQQVTTNVNYNGIVLDSSNPLRDGIQIESIDAVPKEKNLTLTIGFTSLVYYKERRGESTYQKISTTANVNVFNDKTTAEQAKSIGTDFSNYINKDLANKYSFQSDKGDLEEVSRQMLANKELTSEIKKDVDNMKSKNSYIDEIKWTGSEKITENGLAIESGRYESVAKIGNYDERVIAFNEALVGKPESKEKVLRNLENDQTGDWLKPSVSKSEEAKILDDAIAQDSGMSKSINRYNLALNMKDSVILNSYIGANNSSLEIDTIEEKQTIALIGFKLRKLSFSFEKSYFEFPEVVIFVRQKTSYGSTLELYKNFVNQAFAYQQKMYKTEGQEILSDYWNQPYYLSTSFGDNISILGAAVKEMDEATMEKILYNQEADAIAKNFAFKSTFESDKFRSMPKEYCVYRQFVIGEPYFKLHFYDEMFKESNQVCLRSYFFSYGDIKRKNVNFYFDQHPNRDKAYRQKKLKDNTRHIANTKSMLNVKE